MKNKLILIGGSNIDYIGTSKDKLQPGVSNIGTLSTSFGGVMRNVAENLAYLQNTCVFLTAIGNDTLGRKMKKQLKEIGVKVICPKTTYPSSTYLAINDASHDMSVALCDNRIIKELSPVFLNEKKNLISNNEYLALDTNLTDESIEYIFETFKNPKILCETISPAKAVRIKKYVKDIYLLKGNLHEAQALTKNNLQGEALIKSLLAMGIKNVVISHGSKDIFIGTYPNKVIRVGVSPLSDIKNTTGCGDALFAGIIDKITMGASLIEAVEFGHKMAEITLMSDSATSEEIKALGYNHN